MSPVGERQAKIAGDKLATYLRKYDSALDLPFIHNISEHFRMWHSPYKRTRDTTEIFNKALCTTIKFHNFDIKEHLLLHEQKFGLFDGIPDEELPIKYPEEYAYYKKHEDFQGKFWSRIPLGESRADVCQRVHQAFGTFHRDAQKHGIENLIIVAHGTVNRAFIMMWMHYGFEWFEAEKNPGNCSIRLIENNMDRGYIFNGFRGGSLEESEK